MIDALRRGVLLLTFLALGFLGLGQPAGSWVETIAPAVVQLDWIVNGDVETGGNGFILCEPRLGVTAYHVATDGVWQPLSKISLSQYGSPRRTTAMLYHDKETDISFFDPLDIKGCLFLAASDAPPETKITHGSALGALLVVGSTMDIKWSPFFHGQWGEVTNLSHSYTALATVIGNRWQNLAHSNMGSAKGTSGSAILNERLEVVGVLVGGFSSNDTLFVPVSEIRAAIARYERTPPIPPSPPPAPRVRGFHEECPVTRAFGKKC